MLDFFKDFMALITLVAFGSVAVLYCDMIVSIA